MELASRANTNSPPTPALPEENNYGHRQRVEWIATHLDRSDRVVEFGCGTGYFITYPLLAWGYRVVGVDLDEASIRAGRELLAAAGLDPGALGTSDLADLPGEFDAVIASEVLEHLTDGELVEVLDLVHSKLRPGGRLIVTVPNGYGWFELESFLWTRLRLDRLYGRVRDTGPVRALRRAKRSVASGKDDDPYPMTLAPTPHLQRFTWRSLRRTLERAGFALRDGRGAVLFCGPISDMLVSGFPRLTELNKRLGRRFPRIAADFYAVAERR